MDTIIYLYLRRNQKEIQPFYLERLHCGSYILLKVGLERTWVETCKLLREAEDLWQMLRPLIDYPKESYLIYEQKLLNKTFHLLWQQICPFPEFVYYRQDAWAELLLPYAKCADYLVLGASRVIPEFLRDKGAHMKSLKWILPHSLYTDDIKQFEEDFLFEYGMTFDMQIIPSVREFRQIPISATVPVNVIDFSGEEKLCIASLPAESIWLDMASAERKQRRIEAANPQISYISLKKQWKEAKKDCNVLDTISKNRYNT